MVLSPTLYRSMAGNAAKPVGQALGLTNPKGIAPSFVEKGQLDRWQQMKKISLIPMCLWLASHAHSNPKATVVEDLRIFEDFCAITAPRKTCRGSRKPVNAAKGRGKIQAASAVEQKADLSVCQVQLVSVCKKEVRKNEAKIVKNRKFLELVIPIGEKNMCKLPQKTSLCSRNPPCLGRF